MHHTALPPLLEGVGCRVRVGSLRSGLGRFGRGGALLHPV